MPILHAMADADPNESRGRLSKESFENRILVDSDGLLAIDKPFDLPSTGRNLEDPDCLQYSVMEHTGAMAWAVHQLDADTTGVNLFVRRKELVAHWKTRMAFPNGRKTYLAVVHGQADFEAKRIESPIGVVATEPVRQLGVHPEGQRAASGLRLVAHGTDSSLLQVEIETGRTHQIRIHLASIGHPLFGEEWYAPERSREHGRQALHAWRLDFLDDNQPGQIQCELPPDLVGLLARLGIRWPR
ncbi:MAG: RNA pseudouridine synthase [Planctomycetota bacterium]|nr:RNA pseudouridine synthase [Planctomycetota bacterium]